MSDQARATIEIGATTAQLAAGLRRGSGMIQTFARAASSAMKRVGGIKMGGGSIGAGMLGAIGGFAAGAAGRGLDIMAEQGKAVMDFERNLTRLGIAGSLSQQKLGQVRDAARNASSAFGIGADEILAGTQTYVDLTGDVAGATRSMETFAKIAQASGASVSDTAEAAAAFRGIGVPLEEMEARFSGLITQGKAGAVSLKDFAGELAGLAPRWAKFKDSTSGEGIAQLGAAFQVARQGFGSASEAATGMAAMMGALTQNAKKFEAAGVKIFDKNPKTGVKTMRSFEQIMKAIEGSKLIKDPTLMTKAMGSKEALQTVDMLMRARREVTATGTAYGDLVNAGKDAGAVNRDLATYLESSAGKMDRAWELAKNKMAEVFTPARIESFANALGHAVDLLAKMVGYIEQAGKWVHSKTVEGEAEADVEKRVRVSKARGPEVMLATANKLLSEQSRLELKGHAGGRAGRHQDAWVEKAREEGFKLRDEAEAMIRKANPWDDRVNKSVVDSEKMSKHTNQALAKEIAFALKDALVSTGALAPEIRIGDNQVAKSKSKATERRNRP
jgi:hypothetical protein